MNGFNKAQIGLCPWEAKQSNRQSRLTWVLSLWTSHSWNQSKTRRWLWRKFLFRCQKLFIMWSVWLMTCNYSQGSDPNSYTLTTRKKKRRIRLNLSKIIVHIIPRLSQFMSRNTNMIMRNKWWNFLSLKLLKPRKVKAVVSKGWVRKKINKILWDQSDTFNLRIRMERQKVNMTIN